jgi:phage terminase large subunit-like protein
VAKADRTIQEVVKPYSPHQPHPKQRAFLELDAQEVLFGGSSSSGKSDGLLMAALQYVDHPSYSALLLRKREVDLFKNNAIGDRAKKWFAGTAAIWDSSLTGFRFPSGATIGFGHLANMKDRAGWKGPDYQMIGVEELTEWDEGDYVFLFSRLRSTDPKVPTRMRANTNPGDVGHEWVWERFVRYATQSGTGLGYDDWRGGTRGGSPVFESPASAQVIAMAKRLGVHAQGAHFVPAFAEDNPSVNLAQYMMNLAKLDPVEFAWYGEGDWNARPSGKVFQREWFAKFLDVEPPGVTWVRYWDLAGTDPEAPGNEKKDPAFTAGVKLGLWYDDAGGLRVVIADSTRDQKGPDDVPLLVKAVAEVDGKSIAQVFELEPGSAGISVVNSYARATLIGWDVHGHRKTGDKPTMWRPLASIARAGGLYLVRGQWNRDFVDELVGLPSGKKDQADAAAGGYAWLLERSGGGPPADVGDAVLEDARDSPWT